MTGEHRTRQVFLPGSQRAVARNHLKTESIFKTELLQGTENKEQSQLRDLGKPRNSIWKGKDNKRQSFGGIMPHQGELGSLNI
jgi:hypothetical protein